jgi:hypothetical protein
MSYECPKLSSRQDDAKDQSADRYLCVDSSRSQPPYRAGAIPIASVLDCDKVRINCDDRAIIERNNVRNQGLTPI